MKHKQILFNPKTKTLFFKQNLSEILSPDLQQMPDKGIMSGYYDNALIGLFFSHILLEDYPVRKIHVKLEFVEIDFTTPTPVSFQILKNKFARKNFHQTKKFNWKIFNEKKWEIVFENWAVINQIKALDFDSDLQIDKTLFENTEINNYSSFINKNSEQIQRLQLKIPIQETLLPTDHRKINQTLKIFRFINEIGPGLPFWLPKGETVKYEIKNYLRQLEKDNGFIFVNTPPIANKKIYEVSGHLKHYEEYMFPIMERNQEFFVLRPMTCPHHCLFFASEIRSYLDLPMRISENSLLFRYETSGSLSGLERTRQMELKDSHIFLQKDSEQIKKEIKNYFRMTRTALQALGIEIKRIYLSTHDSKESKKYFQDAQLWKETEFILAKGLDEMKVDYQIMKGEAAFYGPKIDLQINNALNHDITISTIQLDFLLPQRFQLKYRTAAQTKDNREAQPIIIHHGIVGTYERLISILLEKNKGWLPFWLSPIQIAIIPMSNDSKTATYIQKIYDLLYKHNLRIQIMKVSKSVNANIKKVWMEKIPFHIFVGLKEEKSQFVTFTDYRKPNKKEQITVLQLIDRCVNLLQNHQ